VAGLRSGPLLLSLLAVVGCGESAGSKPKAPGNRPAASEPKTPAQLPPVEARVQLGPFDDAAILEGVCGSDNVSTGTPGCCKCPSFTSESTEENTCDSAAPGETPFKLDAIRRGNFTEPNLEQAAVTMFACEPHANNFGGTVLVERVRAGARFTRYDQGWAPGDCLSHSSSDGRTVLLCSGSWAREVTMSWLYVRDWTRNGYDMVMQLDDDKNCACNPQACGGRQQKVTHAAIKSFAWSAAAGNPYPAVVAEIEYAVFEGPSLSTHKNVYCGITPDKLQRRMKLGPTHEERLQLRAEIAAQSAAALAPYLMKAFLEFRWNNGQWVGSPDAERVLAQMR
jgi:hypothetical protein